jgi:hypothetical protein
MPRKSKAVLAAEQAAKEQAAALAQRAARPFADDSTDPYAGRDADGRKAVAEQVRDAKLAGASGNEMRERFGARLTGPARRKLLREHGFGSPATIARSYDAYRDGESRTGTRHAKEHGAAAQAQRAAAREEAQAELAAAQAARKGRSKADRAAYAERVAQAQERVASLA